LRLTSLRHLRWRPALAAFVLIAAVVLSFLWCIGVLDANFRIVTPGKFYRSGQMDAQELRQVVSAYHIRTIINLRGANQGSWYAQEKEAAKELSVSYVDIFNLDANRLPPPQAVANLLQAYRSSPYPILVHCKAGSDRAGLASAIYLAVIERVPPDSAIKEQLTWRYGHFPVGEVRRMDDFFDMYNQAGNGKPLESWIVEDYPSLYHKCLINRVKSSL
jgi:protein tyrosine phosphatase (PTP) superfamily phosphohydrolase (DUF442 family)